MTATRKTPIWTRFGKLKFLGIAYNKYNALFWYFLCDCGRTTIKQMSKIETYKSCCKECDYYTMKPTEPTYYVDDNWCWICNNKHKRNWYARFWKDWKILTVHRYMYEKKYWPIPEGMFVCHKCDNRACINPDHMFLWTQKDNMVDMTKKQRHPNRKLPDKSVCEIRNDKEHTQQFLADKYNVDQYAIRGIKNKKRYKRLTDTLSSNPW